MNSSNCITKTVLLILLVCFGQQVFSQEEVSTSWAEKWDSVEKQASYVRDGYLPLDKEIPEIRDAYCRELARVLIERIKLYLEKKPTGAIFSVQGYNLTEDRKLMDVYYDPKILVEQVMNEFDGKLTVKQWQNVFSYVSFLDERKELGTMLFSLPFHFKEDPLTVPEVRHLIFVESFLHSQGGLNQNDFGSLMNLYINRYWKMIEDVDLDKLGQYHKRIYYIIKYRYLSGKITWEELKLLIGDYLEKSDEETIGAIGLVLSDLLECVEDEHIRKEMEEVSKELLAKVSS